MRASTRTRPDTHSLGGRRRPRTATAAVALGVVSVGAASGTGIGASPTTTTPTGTPTTTPSALKPIDPVALQALVERRIEELHVPGAVVLLRTPQGEFTAAAGTTELGVDSPPSTDTQFRIASNTKTMPSAVILQLAQEGKLQLDDPVSDYVADVPGGDDITLAQLLQMRSGLYNYTNDPIVA